MIGSFASNATASLVAKNGNNKDIPLLRIRSSKKPPIKKIKKYPPKVGIMIKNTTLKFVKLKLNLENTLKRPKKSKTYIKRPQIKKFYKTYPQKSEI